MNELTPDDLGRWRVTTCSGTVHVLEIQKSPAASWVTRMARMESPTEEVESVDLRRDDERIELLGVGRLRVGERGLMLLDLRRDGVQTIRTTTEIVSIDAL